MGIKNVNGQNAYVIEAPAFESRTSRGEGYAQYITNLRWKMWEEAQKSIQVEMEFEKMAYQEQMRFLRSQQQQIQRDIAATNRRLADLDRLEADKKAGRKTLPIAIGKGKASIVYSVLTIIVYLWIIGAWVTGQMPVFSLIALLTLPLAIKAIRGARKHQDMSQLIPGMANNVLVVLLTQLLLGIGYILATVF